MIQVALASFGMSGQIFHAPFINAHKGFRLKKILERTKNLSHEQYFDATIVRDFEDLLTDNIDLVVINTPDATHFELSKRAICAGKHIVVEKPFTATIDEGKELVRLAKEQGVKVAVYQNRRFDSGFLTLKKVIDEGKIGKVVELRSYFDRYRNYVKDNWKKELDFGYGAICNLGSHLIDQALALFGVPQAVFADIQSLRAETNTDDYYDIRLYYADKRVILKSSYLAKFSNLRYVLQATNGAYVKYGDDVQEAQLNSGKLPGSEGYGKEPAENWGYLTIHNENGDIEERVEAIKGNYGLFYDNVYEALANGKSLDVPGEDGLNVIKIIESARKSHKERRVVEV